MSFGIPRTGDVLQVPCDRSLRTSCRARSRRISGPFCGFGRGGWGEGRDLRVPGPPPRKNSIFVRSGANDITDLSFGTSMRRQSLYFTGPREMSLREEPLDRPGLGQVLVQTIISAISPGTEVPDLPGPGPPGSGPGRSHRRPGRRLFLSLEVWLRRGGPGGRSWAGGFRPIGRTGWSSPFIPTKATFWPPPMNCCRLPDDLTPEDAVFFPNMETAVTFLLDGQPLMGEQVAIFGQGIVGLLLTALLAAGPWLPGDPGPLSQAPPALRRPGGPRSAWTPRPRTAGALAAAISREPAPIPGPT